MLPINQWVNDEIKEEIRKYLKTKDNENTTFQNLCDAAKAVLRGKYTVIQAFLKEQEKSQKNKKRERIRKRRTKKIPKSVLWERSEGNK